MLESKEERDRKIYSKSAMIRLMELKKRLKAIKQMPALVANRNESLLAQDRYNKEIDYTRLRKNINSKIPPYQGNKGNMQTVVGTFF
jgi:hypothetical protein